MMAARRDPHFLAGLFDDITTSQVLYEMNLVDGDISEQEQGVIARGSKREALECLQFPSSVRSETFTNMPQKKPRLLTPPSTLSVRSRASTQNLAELSFPPLQVASETGKVQSRSSQLVATRTMPIPQISLTRRRQVSARSSFLSGGSSSKSSSETNMARTSPFPHFIPPDCMAADDESSFERRNLDTPRQRDSKFGWFVDLDHYHPPYSLEDSKQVFYQSLPSSLRGSLPVASTESLAYQAPVAPLGNQDRDSDLEWAMAVDAIDSIFGGGDSA
jgi:hypothetical protein